jgi:hypothetical protein
MTVTIPSQLVYFAGGFLAGFAVAVALMFVLVGLQKRHAARLREKPQGEYNMLGYVLNVPMRCPKCGWTWTLKDCEPDVDGDGGMGCPKCRAVAETARGCGKD